MSPANYPIKTRSTASLWSALLITLFLILDLYIFSSEYNLSAYMDLVLTFHQVPLVISVLFAWLGRCKASPGYMLTAAILMVLSSILAMSLFMFTALPAALAFIGFANQRTINQRLAELYTEAEEADD